VTLCVLLACSSKKAPEGNSGGSETLSDTELAPPGTGDKPVVVPDATAVKEDKTIGGMPSKEVLGKAGFDWLTASAACEIVSDATVGKLSSPDTKCERKHEDPFGTGTDRDVIHCKVEPARRVSQSAERGEASEYLLFESEEVCTEMLETMKANAP